jgi:hypothetical protein
MEKMAKMAKMIKDVIKPFKDIQMILTKILYFFSILKQTNIIIISN